MYSNYQAIGNHKMNAVQAGFIVALLSILSTLISCSGPSEVTKAPEDPSVLATYEGGMVTADEFVDRYSRSTPTGDRDTIAAYEDFLERYVNFKIKVLDARKQGRDKENEIRQELESYRSQLARPYLIERIVFDSLARDLYKKQSVELRVGHILKRVATYASPEDTLAAYTFMLAVSDSLAAGADFETMARRHSEDQTASRNGGVLGFISGGRLIYPFEDVAYQTPAGELSPVFRTDFGYHVIKVFEKRDAEAEIKASHILVTTSSRDTLAARARLDSVVTRIKAGEEFSELAREYSDDRGSAVRGGDLGFFGRGRMVQAFEDAAFSLKEIGDLSEVVATRFGYHVIQLTDRGVRKSYEDEYENLKSLITRMPRATAAELKEGRKHRMKVGSSVDLRTLDSLLVAFGSKDSLYAKVIATSEMPVAIASIGDSTYNFDDFTAFLRATRKPATPSVPAHFHKLADDFLDRKGFDHAVGTLADRDEDFGRLMAEYEEGILLFAVSEDSVWNPASADSMALVSLYEKNRDSLWYPERRRIIGFQTRVDSALSLISSRFEAGEPMAAIFDSARTWAADMRIDTTFIADSTFSVYDSTLKLEEGQNSGILQTRSGSMFLYFDAMEAPREKTFEEARADLVSMHQETLEENWIERLRKRYRVRTFPQRLSHVHGSLNAESAK